MLWFKGGPDLRRAELNREKGKKAPMMRMRTSWLQTRMKLPDFTRQTHPLTCQMIPHHGGPQPPSRRSITARLRERRGGHAHPAPGIMACTCLACHLCLLIVSLSCTERQRQRCGFLTNCVHMCVSVCVRVNTWWRGGCIACPTRSQTLQVVSTKVRKHEPSVCSKTPNQPQAVKRLRW